MIEKLINALLLRWHQIWSSRARRSLGEKVAALDKKGFVFVSNNCIAGQLYEMAGLEKRTPTAGLYFRKGAYPSFLAALADRSLSEWASIDAGELRMDKLLNCPVWDRSGDDAVVFLHYPSRELAASKWNSRFPRIENRTPIVIATLRDQMDRFEVERALRRYSRHVVLEPSTGRLDNDGLDRSYLLRLDAFLERVLEDSIARPPD